MYNNILMMCINLLIFIMFFQFPNAIYNVKCVEFVLRYYQPFRPQEEQYFTGLDELNNCERTHYISWKACLRDFFDYSDSRRHIVRFNYSSKYVVLSKICLIFTTSCMFILLSFICFHIIYVCIVVSTYIY